MWRSLFRRRASQESQTSIASNDDDSHAKCSTLHRGASVNDIKITPDARFFALAADLTLPRSRELNDVTEQRFDEGSVPVFELNGAAVRSSYSAHASSPQAVALSVDGFYACSADYDANIALWRADSAQLRATLLGHTGAVTTLDLSPTADKLASGADDSSVRLWDTATEQALRVFRHHTDRVTACQLDMTPTSMLSAAWDGSLFLWDLRQQEPASTIMPHSRRAVTSCAVDRLWRTFVTVGVDEHARLWDARMCNQVHSLRMSKSIPFACSISGNGARIAACGDNGTLCVWNATSPDNVRQLNAHARHLRVTSCATNDNGTCLVSGGQDGTALLWKLERIPLDADALVLEGDSEVQVRVDSHVSALFCNYMNRGEVVKGVALKNAIVLDRARRAFTSLADVLIAHTLVKTALRANDDLTALFEDPEERNDFLYENLYHELTPLMISERARDFGRVLLHDARTLGILGGSDVRSIMGDALMFEMVQDALDQFRSVFAEVYSEVHLRINTLEDRSLLMADELSALREEVGKMSAQMTREAKARRWASVVKLGASIIPLAGSIAAGFVDVSAELFLAFDAESLIEVISETVNMSVQGAVDLTSERSEEETTARLAQLITSPQVLNHPRVDARPIVETIVNRYGADSSTLYRDIGVIISEHLGGDGTQLLVRPSAR